MEKFNAAAGLANKRMLWMTIPALSVDCHQLHFVIGQSFGHLECLTQKSVRIGIY